MVDNTNVALKDSLVIMMDSFAKSVGTNRDAHEFDHCIANGFAAWRSISRREILAGMDRAPSSRVEDGIARKSNVSVVPH